MICTPIKKKTLKSILAGLKETQKVADIVEIWFDELKFLDEGILKKIFSLKIKPFICKFSSDTQNVEKILKYKPEFIDLDISMSVKIIRKVKKLSSKTKIIISFHDYKKTPDNKTLRKIAKNIISKKADIIKIATYAEDFTDSLRMLEFLGKLTKKGNKAICLCMGKEGRLTRMAGHLFGNYLMYAPVNEKDKTAEGQISAAELKNL